MGKVVVACVSTPMYALVCMLSRGLGIFRLHFAPVRIALFQQK